MNNPNQMPDREVNQSPSDDNTPSQTHDPSRRSQNHIQGEEIGTTGGTRDRQPQQTMVPDSELER